jgi:hypothetical protein
LSYLPRALFFNAFELGAVVCENSHISARKELKAKAAEKNLKQERASKNKYETHLSLTHFL